jgi:hypothetical protein
MSRHFFLDSAQQGTIVPAGVRAYREYTMLNDRTPVEPVTFAQPRAIEKLSAGVTPGD